MAPKKESRVWDCYEENAEKRFECKYCSASVSKNANRAKEHTLFACTGRDKLPADVRKAILEESKLTSKTLFTRRREATEIRPLTHEENANRPGCSSSGPMRAYVASLDKHKKTEIDAAFAKAVYAMNLPFRSANNYYLKAWARLLNPAYQLPSLYKVAYSLLNTTFEEVQKDNQKAIESSDNVSLVIDGWSNIRMDSILTFCICNPTPYYYQSIDTEEEKHTAEAMASIGIPIISRIGSSRVIAIVADNAANMKKMGMLVQKHYQHIEPIGCGAHILNLIIQDILSIPQMEEVYAKGKQIVVEIRNSHIKLAKYRKLIKEE